MAKMYDQMIVYRTQCNQFNYVCKLLTILLFSFSFCVYAYVLCTKMVSLIRDPEGKNVFTSSRTGEGNTDNAVKNFPAELERTLSKLKEQKTSSEPKVRRNSCPIGSVAAIEVRNGHTKSQKTKSVGKYRDSVMLYILESFTRK